MIQEEVGGQDLAILCQPFLCANVCAELENGAPGAIPTRDLPLRRRTLYAAELREHET